MALGDCKVYYNNLREHCQIRVCKVLTFKGQESGIGVPSYKKHTVRSVPSESRSSTKYLHTRQILYDGFNVEFTKRVYKMEKACLGSTPTIDIVELKRTPAATFGTKYLISIVKKWGGFYLHILKTKLNFLLIGIVSLILDLRDPSIPFGEFLFQMSDIFSITHGVFLNHLKFYFH